MGTAVGYAIEGGRSLVELMYCDFLGRAGDEVFNQLAKWQAGPHSKTFEVLGTDKTKAPAAKLGVTEPQKSPKCLRCHSTAYWFSEEVKTEKVKP